jgi:hypothetical protein
MNTVQNGKGRGPEKGRDLSKWREGFDLIDWGHPQDIQRWEPSQPGETEQKSAEGNQRTK